MDIILLPTCDPNIDFCPENGKFYVKIRDENYLPIRWVALEDYIEGKR